METWQAINTLRVVREFSERAIEPTELERILNAGRRTGSSKNDQHWAFVVVRDRDHLRELAAVGHYAGHLAGATLAIALVTPDASGHYNNSVMWDCGRAAQSMVLAAWELGIGSVPPRSTTTISRIGCLGCPMIGAATSSSRSAIRPIPRSSRLRTAPAGASRSRSSSTRSAGRAAPWRSPAERCHDPTVLWPT